MDLKFAQTILLLMKLSINLPLKKLPFCNFQLQFFPQAIDFNVFITTALFIPKTLEFTYCFCGMYKDLWSSEIF